MKRILSLFLALSALMPATLLAVRPLKAHALGTLSAECAALYSAQDRRMLYGKNERARHAMASTTKIMTALVALESLSPDTVIKIPKEAVGIEGSSVYLAEGDSYTLRALLYALMLQSANDAAAAIAHAVSGGTAAFAEKMNARASSLGLTDTHFENPHGLDGDTHYTTASDLAIIACEALENPLFYEIVSTRRYLFSTISGEKARPLINHNKLLMLYEGAVGVKTGYTKRCGRCLVSAAKRDGLLLVAVTLDAPSDWQDHTDMLDFGFERYESRLLAEPGALTLALPIFNGTGTVMLTNRDEVRLLIERDKESPAPRYEIAAPPVTPIRKGEIAGTVIYEYGDITVSSPLVYSEDIPGQIKSKGWFGIRRHIK